MERRERLASAIFIIFVVVLAKNVSDADGLLKLPKIKLKPIVHAANEIAADIADFTMNEILNFRQFKTLFNKVYDSIDLENRALLNFVNIQRSIERHNQKFFNGEVTFLRGICEFSDMSADEMNAVVNRFVKPGEKPRKLNVDAENSEEDAGVNVGFVEEEEEIEVGENYEEPEVAEEEEELFDERAEDYDEPEEEKTAEIVQKPVEPQVKKQLLVGLNKPPNIMEEVELEEGEEEEEEVEQEEFTKRERKFANQEEEEEEESIENETEEEENTEIEEDYKENLERRQTISAVKAKPTKKHAKIAATQPKPAHKIKPKVFIEGTLVTHEEEAEENSRRKRSATTKEYLNYTEQGIINPVLNQGLCGSCWSFASAAAIEAHYCLKTGQLIKLSEQQLIDCNRHDEDGNFGCEGGNMAVAFEFLQQFGGITLSSSYPYEANDTFQCREADPSPVRVTSFGSVEAGNEAALKEALDEHGPVTIAVDASLSSFQSYKAGVYYDPECTTEANHAVLLVGYGTDEDTGQEYWLIKNTYGKTWSLSGYMKLARNRDNHCGVAEHASYPILE